MATRLIGTDSDDPWLPDVVKSKATQAQVDDVAGNFTAGDVEAVLAELSDTIDTIVITGGSMPAASDVETIEGTSTAKAVTPAGLAATRAPAGSLFYVHPAAGNDTWDGRSPGSAFASIAKAFTVAPAGAEIRLAPGTHVVSNVTAKSGYKVIGSGGETKVRWSSTTGDVFNLAGCSDTTWRDMALIPNGVQKTAGSLFNVAAGTARHRFENLFIQSPYRAFTIAGGNVTLRDISLSDYNATWPQDYSIGVVGIGATSVTIDKVVAIANGQAGQPNGLIYLASGCSSITINDVIYSSPNTGLGGVIGLNVPSAQWVYVTNCEFESGTTADACVIGGNSDGIHLHHNHFIGVRGVVVQGTAKFVHIEGGEIVDCMQHGVHVVAGQHVVVRDVMILDPSQQTTNTYDGVRVAAGVTDVAVLGNIVAASIHGNGNVAKYGVNIEAGASNRYHVVHNRIIGAGTAAVFDGGTGMTKVVVPNDADAALAATAPAMFGRTGEYWASPVPRTTAVLTAGMLTTHPVFVPSTVNVDRIGVEVTALAAGSTLTLGIYDDNGSGDPGALIIDAGTVSGAAVAAVEATVAVALPGGRLYHLAVLCQGGTPTVRALNGTWSGRNTALASATAGSRFGRNRGAIAGTALPNPAATANNAVGIPVVAVRFA